MACIENLECPSPIITKGLGQPAKNNLIYGHFHLRVKATPDATQLPEPTPSSTIPPNPNPRPGGAGYSPSSIRRREEVEEDKLIQIRVKWDKHDSNIKMHRFSHYWDNVKVKRIGEINKVKNEFHLKYIGLKDRFKIKWKK